MKGIDWQTLAIVGGGIAAGVALNNNSNAGTENSDNKSAAV